MVYITLPPLFPVRTEELVQVGVLLSVDPKIQRPMPQLLLIVLTVEESWSSDWQKGAQFDNHAVTLLRKVRKVHAVRCYSDEGVNARPLALDFSLDAGFERQQTGEGRQRSGRTG